MNEVIIYNDQEVITTSMLIEKLKVTDQTIYSARLRASRADTPFVDGIDCLTLTGDALKEIKKKYPQYIGKGVNSVTLWFPNGVIRMASMVKQISDDGQTEAATVMTNLADEYQNAVAVVNTMRKIFTKSVSDPEHISDEELRTIFNDLVHGINNRNDIADGLTSDIYNDLVNGIANGIISIITKRNGLANDLADGTIGDLSRGLPNDLTDGIVNVLTNVIANVIALRKDLSDGKGTQLIQKPTDPQDLQKPPRPAKRLPPTKIEKETAAAYNSYINAQTIYTLIESLEKYVDICEKAEIPARKGFDAFGELLSGLGVAITGVDIVKVGD